MPSKARGTRRSKPGLLFLVLFFLVPSRGQAETDFRFLPAYFTGDFGSDIETRIAYVPLILTARSHRNEFKVTVPFLSIQTDREVTFVGGEVIPGTSGERQTETGLGDVLLQDDCYLVEGSTHAPWIYAGLRIKLPTGDESRGLGTGATDFGPGAGIIQPLGGRWSLLAEARYVLRGDPPGIDYRNTLWVTAGIQAKAWDSSWISLYYDRRESVLQDRNAIADLSLGFDRMLSAGSKLRSAVFVGLSDSAEDYGVSLGLSWSLSSRNRGGSESAGS
jgi:hypothetical protein